MFKQQVNIGNHLVGENQPVFIIAEISANHQKDFERAKKLIVAAKEAGVDAVKVQTYTQDSLTIDVQNDYFKVNHPLWQGKTLYQLYAEACMPWEWHEPLKQFAQSLGLIFFSTAYDFSSCDFLTKLDVPVFKIASFELVDIPLIQRVAATGKPIIMSTGMGTLEEIALAVEAVQSQGNNQLILLKCTSAYPAKAQTMNLNAMPYLKSYFNLPVGLSDHCLTNDVTIASIAMGAKVIEKHFTLSRSDGGPDAAFSLEPHELKSLVKSVRGIESALGNAEFKPTDDELKSIAFRKSLFAVENIARGEVLTEKNIRSIRPSNGLPPKLFARVLGRRVNKDIKRGEPLTQDVIDGNL